MKASDHWPSLSFNNIGNTAYSDNMNQWLSLLIVSGLVMLVALFKKRRTE